LENQISCLKVRMGTIADELSVQRKRAAKKLAAAVKKELAELNLKQVVFEIHLSRRQDPMGIPLREGFSAFCRTGADDVEFLVSTNPGEPLKPLEAIASTGELSRFTLALKVALAEADKTPVLVFDEIDIGIGGRSGEVVGQKLWRLARHHQVLCVTHLPQIAAYGEKHYRVEKDKLGERTVSRLYEVTGASRLKELTDMIGGASPGEAASRTAAELIKNAAAWVALQSS
jgi:DNA repair protein RecN (Recombination protein N)